MDDLRELISVLSRKRVKRITLINKRKGQPSLYRALYEGIKTGEFVNDTDAAKALLGVGSDAKSYLMLKNRLRHRLINQLFFLDLKESDYSRAALICNRDFFAGKFLVMNGSLKQGGKLIKVALNKALKIHLHDISVQCLKVLKYISSFNGQAKLFESYSELLRTEKVLFDAELEIEDLYQKVTLILLKSAYHSAENVSFAEQSYLQASEILEKHFSPEGQMHVYRLQLYFLFLKRDFDGIIWVASRAQDFIRNHPSIYTLLRIGEFALHKMEAALYLGDFERGKAIGVECEALFRKGSVNWFIYKEFLFLFLLRTGRLEEGWSLYEEVKEIGSIRFFKQDELRAEKWIIFNAYLQFLSPKKEIDTGKGKKFILSKFLNEVPNYSKDRKGLNVAVLSLQYLILLKAGKYDEITRLSEYIRLYISRYLKEPSCRRSALFLKMLLTLEKKSFNAEQTSKSVKKYLNELSDSSQSVMIGEDAFMEMVPFQQLWLLVEKSLLETK